MSWLAPIAGGALIGLAVLLLRITTARTAGVSGLAASTLLPQRPKSARLESGAFLLGLFAVGLMVFTVYGAKTDVTSSPLALGMGGLLVGFGTRLANGCTSGHGICGVARGARRSIVATLVFVAAGFITLALEHVK